MATRSWIRPRTTGGLVAALAVLATVVATVLVTGTAGYAATGPTFTWHLDETSGTTMVDSTGGQNGTLHNVTLGQPGISGGAYQFDGSSSDVVVPDNDVLNPYDADVHISLWLKTTTVPSVPDYDLFRKGEYPGQEYKMELQPNGQASCDFRGSITSQSIQQGPDLSDGAWHHVQCDKTATAVSETVDGNVWSKPTAVGSISNSFNVVVGAYPFGDFYQGLLDEITMQFGPSSTAGPSASFTTSPSSGTAPLAVQFTDTSTGSPTSWSWDFGDGSAPSTAENPQHTYTKAGTFTVKLTASNAGGSDTTTRTVTVAAPVPAPTASFTASPGSGTAPLAVQFTDTSTGSPTSWSWDFGDGSAPSTAQDPKHTFTTPGSYPVTLTVTNTSGHDEVTHTIDVVDGTAPQGTYTVSPTSAWTGWTRVVLTQQSLSDDSTPADQIRRVVDWGDGTAAVDWTTGTHLGHVYRTSGQHVPTVELTDLAGNSVVLTLSPVTVTDDDIAPTARLRVPAAQHRASSWRWLRGTAADAQTGVALVEVRAVEKRGHHWYAYRPAQHRWVRAADRAAALDRAGWARIRPAGRDWSSRLQGVRVGTLVVQLTARDHVGNTAPVRSHRFLLTRW